MLLSHIHGVTVEKDEISKQKSQCYSRDSKTKTL